MTSISATIEDYANFICKDYSKPLRKSVNQLVKRYEKKPASTVCGAAVISALAIHILFLAPFYLLGTLATGFLVHSITLYNQQKNSTVTQVKSGVTKAVKAADGMFDRWVNWWEN